MKDPEKEREKEFVYMAIMYMGNALMICVLCIIMSIPLLVTNAALRKHVMSIFRATKSDQVEEEESL